MKESKLKISVIVATYNQEKFIGRCLRSLLHQTLPHAEYEIVVINDGSNDKTGFALELFCDHNDSIVKVLTNKSNVGLPSSLNRGLENAKGKYIVRVDSDDFVNTNFLNFLLCYIETNKSADAVACDYLLLDDRENELKRCNCEKEPIACGILFKKEHLFNIGLYDEKFLKNTSSYKDSLGKMSNQHAITLPGFIAFSYYSNSKTLVFLFALIISILCNLIVQLFQNLLQNPVLSAFVGNLLAYRLIHWGYAPLNSYKLILALFLSLALIILVNHVLKKIYYGK